MLSCKKDKGTPIPTDTGTFTASINGQSWNPHRHSATYYSQWKQLYISCKRDEYDNPYGFNAGFIIDPANALRTYLLEPNGSSVARVIDPLGSIFFTDQNLADAGGSFTLTKFDTVQHLLSGQFQFKAYTADRNGQLIFSNNVITDIPLFVDAANSYDGSTASCDIAGTSNISWFTKDFNKKISCFITGLHDSTVSISIRAIVHDDGYGDRNLTFFIPLKKPAGTYPVYSVHSAANSCALSGDITCRYGFGIGDQYDYFPTSGTFTINLIDTVARKINANFNVVLKDSLTSQTIQVSNGQLFINGWKGSN